MGAAEEKATRAAYDRVADLYADHFPSTEPEQSGELAQVDRFVNLLAPPRDVLDAGCGAGRFLPYLAERGCHVEGIDLSPEMVRRARQDHPEFVTVTGSIAELPWPDGSFDGVFSWYSTIHTPDEDVGQLIRELRRVLRPGGYLLVAFQSGEGMREVGRGFRDRGYDVRLNRWHRRPEALARHLMEVSLEVVERFERQPVDGEGEAQAVLIARRPPGETRAGTG